MSWTKSRTRRELHESVPRLTLRAYHPGVSNGWGDGERSGRFAALLALGGGATALVSLLLAAARAIRTSKRTA